mgnify:FL=1
MIKPNSERTAERVKEITAAAGLASGESRRKRKAMREAFEVLLSRKVSAENGKKITGVEEITAAMYAKALRGDVQAFKAIAEIMGEYQQQIKVDATAEVKAETRPMSIAEAQEFLRELEGKI